MTAPRSAQPGRRREQRRSLQGAVAIAGSLLLAGAGLILDGTKLHGTGWRVTFAATLLAAIVALVMSGVRALSATSTIHRWHRPTATDIVRRSQLSLTQARVQLAAETLADYGFNSKIAAWKVAYLGAAAWWFRIALAVLLALATIVCAYAIAGPIQSSAAPDTLAALDPSPQTTTTPHVEDTLTTATVWLAVGTFVLAFSTVALVVATRMATSAARQDAKAQITATREAAEREVAAARAQLLANEKPLLIEVFPSGPIYADMGATPDRRINAAPGRETPQVILLSFRGGPSKAVDPRNVFVELGAPTYVSVPLRNVGRGVAVIDPNSIKLVGPALGELIDAFARRYRVPVGETTRIDVVIGYSVGTRLSLTDEWQLSFAYWDVAKQQHLIATVRLSKREDPDGWFITGVETEERPLGEVAATQG